MRKLRQAAAVLAFATFAAAPALSQDRAPYAHLCLEDYSAGAGEARFRVTVDWNGLPAGQYARIDLVAKDGSVAYWPQFHDDRLQPGPDSSIETFTVSDVSRYPLSFSLVGLSKEAADAFDSDCARGFCSLRTNAPGTTQLGGGDVVAHPTPDGRRCE